MGRQLKEVSDLNIENLKAVFFDLDDTLCGYWDAAKAGLAHTLATIPVPGKSAEEFHQAWVEEFRSFADEIKRSHWYEIYLMQGGITRMELMRLALLRCGIDDPRLAFDLGQQYGAERRERLALFPGAIELLHQLKGHYVLGTITNGPADIQRQELQDLGIEDLFDIVQIEGEMGFGKPDPRVMDIAEERTGATGSQILMVGNSYKHDIVPAQERGWQTCWVRRESDVPPTSRTGKMEERPENSVPPTLTIGHLNTLADFFPANVRQR